MKIKQEHYDHMKVVIDGYIGTQPMSTLADYTERGLSAMRYRWDMSYKAGLTPWICENIYPYANDDHIDTALRKITGTK